MESTDLQRVNKLIDWLIFSGYGSNKKEIGAFLGYTKSSFSQILNGKVPLSDRFIDKLSEVDDNINKVWIKTGKGEMLKSEAPEVESRTIVSYNPTEGIPYYDIDFVNGFDDVVDITTENPEYNIVYPPAGNCDFWVNATGYSMQGHINHGDTVALKKVDPEWFPLGEIYAIVTTNNHRMIKRITASEDKECYKLVSSNPDKLKYPDQDIPKKYIRYLFKVVCSIRIVS